jgi:lipopolysaccharide transport system permease protein
MTTGAAGGAPPIIYIRPMRRSWRELGIRQILRYHELLYFLVLRTLKLRYKQTAFGVGWAVLQPVLAMLAFTVVFGRFARLPSEGLPYAVFAYTGLVAWTYFANTLTSASSSLVDNERMLTKVYFPRALLPLAHIIAGLVDLVIALLVLLVLLFVYDVTPSRNIWALPVFIVFAALTALATGLWLSAVNVRYRDVRHAVPSWCSSGCSSRPSPTPAAWFRTGGTAGMHSTPWWEWWTDFAGLSWAGRSFRSERPSRRW